MGRDPTPWSLKFGHRCLSPSAGGSDQDQGLPHTYQGQPKFMISIGQRRWDIEYQSSCIDQAPYPNERVKSELRSA